MAFSDFITVEDVVRRYELEYVQDSFLHLSISVPSYSDYFREEINLNLREIPFRRSEAGVCEALLFPMLREMWKQFRDSLTLLTHETVTLDAELRGEIDYVVCRRSPLGQLIPDQPYLLIVEAKRDDFQRGWGQALAGMLAAQRLDSHPERTYYGIASSGIVWTFGKLHRKRFTQEFAATPIYDFDRLWGALYYIFKECRNQLNLPSEAA